MKLEKKKFYPPDDIRADVEAMAREIGRPPTHRELAVRWGISPGAARGRAVSAGAVVSKRGSPRPAQAQKAGVAPAQPTQYVPPLSLDSTPYAPPLSLPTENAPPLDAEALVIRVMEGLPRDARQRVISKFIR